MHKDRDQQRNEHREKFGAYVEALGRERLRFLLPVRDPQELRRLLAQDEHLNNVPLSRWDAQDPRVRRLLRDALRNGRIGEAEDGRRRMVWSLSDTVCTLKECARQVAEEGS